MGKVIYWELWKKFKFDYTNMSEPILKNETQKLPWNFEIQTDHLMIFSKRKKKKKKKNENLPNRGLCRPEWPKSKLKESEKSDKYLDLTQESKKLWTMKVTVILFVSGAFGTISKVLVKGVDELEIRGQVKTIQTAALLDRQEN